MPNYDYYDGSPWYDQRKSISDVIIGDGVSSIGDCAFKDCSELTFISIPESVTYLGHSAFESCSELTSLTIPQLITFIGDGTFYYCSELTSITIPGGVTFIGAGAFFCCESLTSVTIPNSVTSIGSDAFVGCSGLTSVSIGNSVTSIGNQAFYVCTSLTEVINRAIMPQTIDDYVFENVNIRVCTLRVPESSLAAYRTADVWKEFGSIKGMAAGIKDNTLTGITVYGSENSVYITNNSGTVLKSVQITDMQGCLMYSGKTSDSVSIPVNGAGGIYIVRIISEDNNVLSAKVQLK